MMEFAKLLRDIAHGNWLTDTQDDETLRLRAQNARLKAALEAASEALAEAPLWHAQHRVASNILLDLREELAELAEDAGLDGRTADPRMH